MHSHCWYHALQSSKHMFKGPASNYQNWPEIASCVWADFDYFLEGAATKILTEDKHLHACICHWKVLFISRSAVAPPLISKKLSVTCQYCHSSLLTSLHVAQYHHNLRQGDFQESQPILDWLCFHFCWCEHFCSCPMMYLQQLLVTMCY